LNFEFDEFLLAIWTAAVIYCEWVMLVLFYRILQWYNDRKRANNKNNQNDDAPISDVQSQSQQVDLNEQMSLPNLEGSVNLDTSEPGKQMKSSTSLSTSSSPKVTNRTSTSMLFSMDTNNSNNNNNNNNNNKANNNNDHADDDDLSKKPSDKNGSNFGMISIQPQRFSYIPFFRSLLALYLFTFNSVLQTCFRYLNCQEVAIGNKIVNVVKTYPAVNCDTKLYSNLKILILIVLIVYVVIIPVFLILNVAFLMDKWKSLHDVTIRLVFPYRLSRFWRGWEIWRLIQRTLLVAIVVFEATLQRYKCSLLLLLFC